MAMTRKKKEPARFYTLLLGFGYAESQHLGFVPFTSAVVFGSPRDALVDLAQWLWGMFKKEHSNSPCCTRTLKRMPDAVVCAKCGRRLGQGPDPDDFMAWLRSIVGETQDSWSSEHRDYWDPDDPRWDPGDPRGGGAVVLVWSAEKVLATAVGHDLGHGRPLDGMFGREGVVSYW